MGDADPTGTQTIVAADGASRARGLEVSVAEGSDRKARAIGWAGAAMIALAFSASLLAYAQDTYYQSHFVFLWLFLGAAVWKAGRGRVSWRVGLGSAREAGGFVAVLLALGLLWVGLITGSSTAQRLGLVCVFFAFGMLAMPAWSTGRSLAYAAFAVLCFGMPYSAYYSLTEQFRASFMFMLEMLGPLCGYETQGVVLVFPHYRLAITPDCSGFNQLITFFGLAFLGCLTGRTSLGRAGLLFGVGALLAYASNLFRVIVFVICVALQQYAVIENETLHAAVGFVAYAPFILGFMWLILRTHRALPPLAAPAAVGRRTIPLGALALPFVALWGIFQFEAPPSQEPPAYTAGLLEPPGYAIAERAQTEEWERDAYDTPWLINARFAATDDASRQFEMFAYLTRSRSHLAVHQISNCLSVPGFDVAYGPPVQIGGRTFWSLELIGKKSRHHGYFAFWVDGEDLDDRFSTQVSVFGKRLFGGLEEIGLTRFLMPGPLPKNLPADLPAHEREILEWRARQLGALR